jgi:hypothetical protein
VDEPAAPLADRPPKAAPAWLMLLAFGGAGAAAIWAGYTKEPLWVLIAAASFGALSISLRERLSTRTLTLLVAAAALANLVLLLLTAHF